MTVNNINLCWITPNYFLDTDVYIMRYLSDIYKIKWIITKKFGETLDYKKIIDEIGQKPNVEVEIAELNGRRYSLKGLLYEWRLQREAKNADLIYQPVGLPYSLPLTILSRHGRNSIVPVHNVRTPKGGSRYLINKISTWLTIHLFRNFITFSQSQQQLLRSLNKRANVLYAPFMLKDYGKASIKRTNSLISFLCFGNIRRYKRIDVLIEAAQKAYELTNCPFHVIIAGRCDDWGDYQKIIRYPELFDLRIHRVEDKDIPNLFEESDYFVTPYQDIAQSGSLIVGLNYNKPIIASRLESFEEFVEHGQTGFLMRPANLDDLSEILVHVLQSHNQIYDELKENQRKMIADKFEDGVIVEKYVNYINNIAL